MGTKVTNSNQNKPNLPHFVEEPIPIERLIELRSKNLSYDEIAKIVGRAKPTVWERLQPYIKGVDSLDAFKRNRGDVLAVHQSMLLSSLTPDDIKKMPGGSRYLAVAQLYDKERIERGLSTDNVSVHVVESEALDLDSEIAKLRQLRGQLASGTDNAVGNII